MEKDTETRMFRIVDAAEELGLSPATIRLWIRQRKIGFVRLGTAVRIPLLEIQRLIAKGSVPAIVFESKNVNE